MTDKTPGIPQDTLKELRRRLVCRLGEAVRTPTPAPYDSVYYEALQRMNEEEK